MEKISTKAQTSHNALVGVVMGSQSDWKVMKHTCDMLSTLEISYEETVISAHRTPRRLYNYACDAEASGLKILIAGAGGAAHLPGMLAALTPLPVLGVPIPNHWLNGQDSLFSIVQMPAGIPVGTLAIGKAGAINAALLAGSILALGDASLNKRFQSWRKEQSQAVPTRPFED